MAHVVKAEEKEENCEVVVQNALKPKLKLQSESEFKFKHHMAQTHHVSRPTGWLESRFHFAFAGWWPQDQSRHQFGHLRVVNDDIVKPRSGFGKHPHRDMEIFSYIIDGKLSHRDSKGHAETLSRGAVQYMSAGNGVFHSEMNNDRQQYCRFLQIWIKPYKNSLPVNYGSKSYARKDRHNTILHVISGINSNFKSKAPIQLGQDVNVYVSELDEGKSVFYKVTENRKIYLVNIEGKLEINGVVVLDTRDSIRIWGPVDLKFTARGDGKPLDKEALPQDMRKNIDFGIKPSAHFLMIDLQKDLNEKENMFG